MQFKVRQTQVEWGGNASQSKKVGQKKSEKDGKKEFFKNLIEHVVGKLGYRWIWFFNLV